MATVNPNTSFTRYILTPEEVTQGEMFSGPQLYLLQNMLADAAEEKVAMTFDPLNPVKFAQQEAELGGKIWVLATLIDRSLQALKDYSAVQNQQDSSQDN